MFPRLYQNETCPLDGYDGYTFRVLVNPTGAEKTDWALGHLGIQDCPDCAAIGGGGGYCDACAAAREKMGRSGVAIYGTSRVEGFDFSTPESALATFGMPDLPDELLAWLYMLPAALWAARSEDVKKKLQPSSLTGSSTSTA